MFRNELSACLAVGILAFAAPESAAQKAILRPSGICGFVTPTTSPTPSEHICEAITVLCPLDQKAPGRSSYYKMQIDAALGFDLKCAPTNWRNACDPLAFGRKLKIVAPEIDWKHLGRAIDWSVLAYKTPEEIKSILAQAGIKQVTVGASEIGDLKYFYYITASEQWLVFRGTNFSDLCNEMTDAKSALITSTFLDNLRFHTGFYDATLSALSKIRLDKSKPVYISGHSLGGAAATISAMLLHRQGHQIASVITFGQPQVMDEESVKALPPDLASIRLIRVINSNDVVPNMFWLARILDPYTHFWPQMDIGINLDDPLQFAYLSAPTGNAIASINNHDHCSYQSHMHALIGNKADIPCS